MSAMPIGPPGWTRLLHGVHREKLVYVVGHIPHGLAALHGRAFREDPTKFDPDIGSQIEHCRHQDVGNRCLRFARYFWMHQACDRCGPPSLRSGA